MRCMLVGGPADGEWHDVDVDGAGVPVYVTQVVERTKAPVLARDYARQAETCVPMRKHLYHRQTWRSGPNDPYTYIFVHDDRSAGWVMEQLLQGYGQRARFRGLLREVYNYGETCERHRRIGEAFGVGPGDDIP